MEYEKEIARLREAIRGDRNEDVAKNELYHWEIRRELLLKREQVVSLEKELQEANSKIFDLNRELESSKSLLAKSEFRLKLALKKSTSLEEKLNEVSKSYTALKVEEDMRLSEIQILNNNLQKMAHENHHMSREVVELEDKLKYSRAFQDELEDRQMKINSIIKETRQNCDLLEKEHKKMAELNQKLEQMGSFKNLSESLAKSNVMLKKKNFCLENSLVEISAKDDKLRHLLKNKDPQCPKIIEKIKYLQWESQCEFLHEKNAKNEEILSTLTSTLNNEIMTNTQLLLQVEQYEARLRELEDKLDRKGIKEEASEIISIE